MVNLNDIQGPFCFETSLNLMKASFNTCLSIPPTHCSFQITRFYPGQHCVEAWRNMAMSTTVQNKQSVKPF
ncbi:hypothetical protein APS_2634 [Acetobacter pasteurianus subsp. pasteurianus LMG 1262 = NBRC 106471]|nr:hypothetical protein APS_2634 [Acetobacter pasteurianus subsp. pasteurianus LMG 1262 = NBRC 106471]